MADIILFWIPEFREIRREWKARSKERVTQDEADQESQRQTTDVTASAAQNATSFPTWFSGTRLVQLL